MLGQIWDLEFQERVFFNFFRDFRKKGQLKSYTNNSINNLYQRSNIKRKYSLVVNNRFSKNTECIRV